MTDELRQLEEEWAAAIERRDVAAAESILAEDFTLSSTGGVGDHVSRERWLAVLEQIESRSLTCTVDEVRNYGEIAVVMARLRWDATLGDRNLTGDYTVTDVFRRANGGWRAAWRISVRLPSS